MERGHPVRLSAEREQLPNGFYSEILSVLRTLADRMSAIRAGLMAG